MSEAIRTAFADQADWARRLDAPFTASLCEALGRVIDRTTATGRRVLDWPGDPRSDALVLRLTGGLHALVRSGQVPELAAFYPPSSAPDTTALAGVLTTALGDDRLLPWLDSAPQTNEVARAGVLMPGLMVIAAATGLPLRLFELGASAGLNLRMDHYRYDLGGKSIGPADAPLTLSPAWTGPTPPSATVTVAARRGVDLAPVDACSATGRARLLAFIWPEQTARIERLTAATDAFIADPAPVDQGDAASWVEANVALAPGAATVVYHSIAWQYFPRVTQERTAAHLAGQAAAATVEAPLAWLRYEFDTPAAPRPALWLTLWPGAEARLLAHGHPHGASVEWYG